MSEIDDLLKTIHKDGRYVNTLDLKAFERTLVNKTQCYKLYWLEAIIIKLKPGKTYYTFEELINEMICSAWYTVCEYHLHLGPQSGKGHVTNYIEEVITILQRAGNYPSTLTKREVTELIKKYDGLIHHVKMKLSKYVPYRFLRPFLHIVNDQDMYGNLDDVIKEINKKRVLPYITVSKPEKAIIVDEEWLKMFLDYRKIILEWIKYNKVVYIQKRNPNVPGIVYKIEPFTSQQRNMKDPIQLWKYIIGHEGITNLYDEKQIMTLDDLSLDHFVPWSYVASDELWNLAPTTKAINSSKSNHLPDWNTYFESFAQHQFTLNQIIHHDSQAYQLFERCQGENLFESWAINDLYLPGCSHESFKKVLREHLLPVYMSARSQGYAIWEKIE